MALRLRSKSRLAGARIADALGLDRTRDRLRGAFAMDTARLGRLDGNARIFQVVGVPRSGTTILSVALNAHPEAVCLVEPFLSWLKRGSFPCPTPGGEVEPRSEPPIDAIAELARRDGLQWVGFKETFRLARHPTFPTERFVRESHARGAVDATLAIVRDPRDVWVSTVTRFEEARDTILDEDFTDAWNRFATWVLDAGVYHVRYEDLVIGSETILGKVADRLGLEFHEAMVEPSPTRGGGDARAERGGTLDPSSVGRHREELARSDRAFIEARCGTGMDRLGYAPHRENGDTG